MKKIPAPVVCDVTATTNNSRNSRLGRTSYPELSHSLNLVLAGYNDYRVNLGNALAISKVAIPERLKVGLRKNYSQPPKDLKFIDELRDSNSTVCPMCGSLGVGTLDHILPKEDYPEFSIFSLNLVPACRCNSSRGRYLLDASIPARVLHPYYDTCLSERLISCHIFSIEEGQLPNISLLYVGGAIPDEENVKFHIDGIVSKSGILRWLDGRWERLASNPMAVIQTLPARKLADIAEVNLCLNDALGRHDFLHESRNNWESVFIHGLLNSPGVCQYILETHNSLF